MNSLKRTKINVLPLFFFFWNAFSLLLSFSPWFRLSEARSFRSFANRQPVLSSSQFSDVPCCEAALGQQETFVMCFADLENATVCMGFEDSRKLSRDCHICIDFLMDLVGFQQREEETFHEEKRSWIRSTYKLLQIQIQCGVLIFWDESVFTIQPLCLQVKAYSHYCRGNTPKSFSVVVINCQSEIFT